MDVVANSQNIHPQTEMITLYYHRRKLDAGPSKALILTKMKKEMDFNILTETAGV